MLNLTAVYFFVPSSHEIYLMKPNSLSALDASSIKSLLLIEFHCQEVIFVGAYFGKAISLLLGCHYGVIEKLIKRREKFAGTS